MSASNRRARWLFRGHVGTFVIATCLAALGIGGHGWAFGAGALCTVIPGAFAIFGGHTFLTNHATRQSIEARAESETERKAGERAAATWAGLVLVAFGSVVLYLTTR